MIRTTENDNIRVEEALASPTLGATKVAPTPQLK